MVLGGPSKGGVYQVPLPATDTAPGATVAESADVADDATVARDATNKYDDDDDLKRKIIIKGPKIRNRW